MNDKRLIAWWRTRTSREQGLLLAMAGLAVIVLAWLLVVRPMSDALSEAKQRHGAAIIALAETRMQAAAIRAAQEKAPATSDAPVDILISQSATEAGFPVTRIDRHSASKATLVLEAVRPQTFFGWIRQMEEVRGLTVERLSATPNTDQTLSVQVTFRGRSG